MDNPKLLLVDDDRLILATLTKGLSKYGFTVTTADNITDGMALALADPPDLAVLDIRMPNGSGTDMAKELAKRSIPFIFLSAFGEEETVRYAVLDGALGYLVKPLQISQIVPAINAALARAAEIRTLKETEANLNIALKQKRNVSTAIGILMQRYSVPEQAAFETLRLRARSSRRKLDEVADELIRSVERVEKDNDLA